MNENNNLEQEIQQEDKNAKLQVRTKASLVSEFKNIEGVTDNDKLVKLLELYRKFESTQDKFNVDNNLDVIDKAIATLNSQLNAIVTSVNQYERSLNERYIDGFGEQLVELKADIEKEEILQSKIITLEKSNQELLSNSLENETTISELNEKITMLEAENNKYIGLNAEIVARENNYINQLHEKDNIITKKELELRDLKSEHNTKITELEDEFKKQLGELQDKLELANKEHFKQLEEVNNKHKKDINKLQEELEEVSKKHIKEISEMDKDKSVLQTKIDSLENSVDTLKAEKEALNTNIKEIRQQHKTELKATETEHKTEVKTLEAEVKKAQKESSKLEINIAKLETKLEGKVDTEAKLEQEIAMLKEKLEELENKNKELEEKVKTKKTTTRNTKAKKTKANTEAAEQIEGQVAVEEAIENVDKTKK
jgi:predicted  nucleic acid-binding Zn-ribbon protein